jgi:multidrug efflux pump subunit AcrB
MNFLTIFIKRPVATSLLTLAIALPGVLAFQALPRAALPQVDYPTINISANLPGASPETMAATVATPLERAFGRIAGIEEMTSTNTQGSTRINLQFELDRNIDGAARDVQAAINAARALLPKNIPSNPTYRRINASAAPILAISLTSDIHTKAQLYDIAFSILGQKISQVKGVGQVSINGSALRAVRVEVNPSALNQYGISLEQLRASITSSNLNRPKGQIQGNELAWQIEVNDQAKRAKDYQNLIVAYREQSPIRLSDVAIVRDSVQELRNAGSEMVSQL